jgi:SMI1 / KNR4 family (SUKH-1)
MRRGGLLPMADRYTTFRTALPRSYVEFIESHKGWEGDLRNDIGYVVVWNRQTLQEYWSDCEMAECLSDRWFPFGSNGGGEMLCFDLSSGTDRVFLIPFIGMSDDVAMPWCDSFSDVATAILKAA